MANIAVVGIGEQRSASGPGLPTVNRQSNGAFRRKASALRRRSDGRRRRPKRGGFDLDAILDDDITLPEQPPSPVTMEDLDRVIASPGLMPPGTDVLPMEPRAYSLPAPGMGKRVRVTTDPAYYGEHAEDVELRSPGNPLFNPPEDIPEPPPWPEGTTLGKLPGR